MRFAPTFLALVLLAMLAACSTPESRIAGNRPAFEKFSASVQQKISAGQVEVGFTQEMVRLALGDNHDLLDTQASIRSSSEGRLHCWDE